MRIENLTPKEEWLKEYSRDRTLKKNRRNFRRFCEWANISDVELVEEYKKSNPRDFSKKWGKIIVQYYNDMLKKGYSSNYCRTLTIAPRAFFKSQCVEVKIKRGAIAKQRMATGEHEFLLEELQKMYKVGDIEDKARLATALTLGWGAADFLNLEWEFIEPYLNEKLEPPVAFWYERQKTGAPSRSHLTHEAIECLREWRRITPSSKYLFSGYNGTHLTPNALNAWLKSLVNRSKIKTRGKIRFHLLRKFLLSQLSSSGMNQWEAKLCVGKSIPADILTYLKDLTEDLRSKFMKAEPRFTLTRYTNSNHIKMEELEKRMTENEEMMIALGKFIARYVTPEVVREIKLKGIENIKAFSELSPNVKQKIRRMFEREELDYL